MTSANSALQSVLNEIDTLNKQDPNQENFNGEWVAKEWLYGVRMSERLRQFQPDADEVLQIAARAQHVQRWVIPRSDYPMDKSGYKKWRLELGKFHAETVAKLMQKYGYSSADTDKVEILLTKRNLKRDEQVQALEDVICLVFIEHYLEPFAEKHSEEKLIDIIRKTWNKMSEKGHQAALTIPLKAHLSELVGKALAE